MGQFLFFRIEFRFKLFKDLLTRLDLAGFVPFCEVFFKSAFFTKPQPRFSDNRKGLPFGLLSFCNLKHFEKIQTFCQIIYSRTKKFT